MTQVLIADDDHIWRRLISQALKDLDADITVIEADDGEQAIQILKKNPADIVITDINMPRANGYMVLAYMNAFLPEVPCIVMTAYGTSRLRSKLPPDLMRFYQKPVAPAALAKDVVQILKEDIQTDTWRGFNLISLLSVIADERATCTVMVTHSDGKLCRLYVREGDLVDAVIDDRSGEEAALEALGWEKTAYNVELDCPDDVEKRITASLEDLFNRLQGNTDPVEDTP